MTYRLRNTIVGGIILLDATPEAETALWSYCFGIHLMTSCDLQMILCRGCWRIPEGLRVKRRTSCGSVWAKFLGPSKREATMQRRAP